MSIYPPKDCYVAGAVQGQGSDIAALLAQVNNPAARAYFESQIPTDQIKVRTLAAGAAIQSSRAVSSLSASISALCFLAYTCTAVVYDSQFHFMMGMFNS